MSRTAGARPQISRAFLEHHRRLAFVAAAAELADEFGVRAVTVSMLCSVGHAARNTFYDLFANGEECFRFTAATGYEALFAGLPDPTAEAPDPHMVTRRLGEAAAAEPALVRFFLFHSRSVPRAEGERTPESAVERLAALFAARLGPGTSPGRREDLLARVYIEMLTRRLIADLRRADPEALARLPEELDPWALPLLGSDD
jgi:AcrR family transcriptional regulator